MAQTPFSVSNFTSALAGDGARPNLFQVNMTLPIIAPANQATGQTLNGRNITFKAKAAQLPGSTIGTVPLYYMGREMKFAGNRTFADWTVTIINDEDFSIRNSIELWMNALNSNEGNVRGAYVGNLSPNVGLGYTTQASVTQYGKDGRQLKKYDFVGMFPVDMSPIDLDWGTNDSIEEFSVTFAYQYWNAADTTT